MFLSKSNKFFFSGLLFLAGVALGESAVLPLWFFVSVFTVLIFSITFSRKVRFISGLFLFLFLGLLWSNVNIIQMDNKHISFYNNQEKNFTAVIMSEPDVRLDHQKLTVGVVDYDGKVLLKKYLYPEYNYGDLLEVNCKLVEPEPIEDFKYDRYLARYDIYSICYYPRVKVIDHDQGNKLVSLVLRFKKNVENLINKTISEPQAALTSGILIGSRQGIPRELLDKFNVTGITHIIAISGFNITIIVVLLMNLAKHFYISRKKMIWIIVFALVFFVILTGVSASVVRAAIMGFLVVFAKHLGRLSNVRNVLILSAIVMVFFNPKILVWDAGFQLSFLSTVGLVYLSPILEKKLLFLPSKLAIRENIITTLSAIIFTLPLILFSFHRLSLVALFVNLLVLPIIPLAMLFGFFQVTASLLLVELGQIIGWVTWVMLGYIIKIVDIFAALPFASVEIRINWFVLVVLYLYLFYLVIKKEKQSLGDASRRC